MPFTAASVRSMRPNGRLAKKHSERSRKTGTSRQTLRAMPFSITGGPCVRLVLDNYYQDRITLSDVSGYLGVRVKHVPRIEMAIETR